MTFVEKAQSFIILVAVFVGLALGHVPVVAQNAASFILSLLMLMLMGVFLHVPLRDFKNAFQFRSVAIASLVINFAWTPLFAWLLGWLFLSNQPALWVGFLMLMVTPCTDWYLVFTGISKGNLSLSTALLPVNLVLQLLFLPVYLFVLAGAVFPLNWGLILESIGLVLLLPFFAANALRYLIVRYMPDYWLDQKVLPLVQPAQIVLLALAIVAVFASEGQAITQRPQILLHLLLPILLFFGSNLALAFVVSKWLKSNYENFVSLSYTTLARNSPIALAIAVVAFPGEPLIALALVIGPLIELPVLALISQVLLWIKRKGLFPEGTRGLTKAWS
ncbi:MAG: arsenic resistance protein [Candidatus Loosdrechtia sp.]|uniref:arsenic resistance protein n=1 Tax=Candidatus Loosdrechtia sp. TaxID=3101272 RepID=UPI00403B36B2